MRWPAINQLYENLYYPRQSYLLPIGTNMKQTPAPAVVHGFLFSSVYIALTETFIKKLVFFTYFFGYNLTVPDRCPHSQCSSALRRSNNC
jgi:hypothetical protein